MRYHIPITLFITSFLLYACSWSGSPISTSKQTDRPVSNSQLDSAYYIQHFDAYLLLTVAKRQLGRPYMYGGNSPSGFDCSGLVQYTFAQLGLELPRSTIEQMNALRPIQRNDLRVGDLAFFQTGEDQYHVAIMQDNQTFIHAPSSGKTVSQGSFTNPYWQNKFIGARRY